MRKAILCLAAVAVFGAGAFAATVEGYVSEAHCGAKHDSVSDANSKCIAGCLKHGSDPVLVKDGQVLQFDADSKEKAKSFAGQKVKIDGEINGNTVKISNISKGD